MTDIIALRRYSWFMVTRRRNWNWRVFARPGLGDLNYENPLKEMRIVHVIDNRREEKYLGRRERPGGGVT